MTIAYIIAVYKDIEALSLIIDAIKAQTLLPYEVVVAEDGDSQQIAEFVKTVKIDGVNVIHTFHKDDGWQKDKSLNNALRASSGEYIIITDGDIVPYPEFVEKHKELADSKTVLCGRRVNAGEKVSRELKERKISVKDFANNYIINSFKFFQDKIGNYEEGFVYNPNGWFYKNFFAQKRSNSSLLGCCWSVWREDIEMVNGFDEDYRRPTTGCDTDIERRLRHFGIKFKSCRNIANSIHLYHKEKYDPKDSIENLKIMNSKLDEFVCKNGLKKL